MMREPLRTGAPLRPFRGHRARTVRIALLVLAVLLGAVLVFAGLARGEVPVIMAKATSICYQCIGIG